MSSFPNDRASLLRLAECLAELVQGRADVAARWFDFTGADGKRLKGWAPWKGRRVAKDYQAAVGEVCGDFRDHKNGGFERRLLKPLSPDNLLLHLRGKERLGVYVLDAENQCRFLAADFDDHEGKLDPDAVWKEVKAFWDACDAHDWKAHIERSKSGAGYHVWVFFDAPIPAIKARAIGRWLFEESQLLAEGEDFDDGTFDRFFPAQAELPPAGRGYGNLIGLPLSGAGDYLNGRCAWVHPESGKTIADPLTYTLAIRERGRNPAAQVDEFIGEWNIELREAATYTGEARDPNAALGSTDELRAVVEHCKFMAWASDPINQPEVAEPVWYCMVSNGCRFDNDDWVHDASRHHAGYSSHETELKILHARGSAGPTRCEKIREAGFNGCPKEGCKLPGGKVVSSPAGLSAWAHQGAPRKTEQGEAPAGDAPPKRRQPWRGEVALYPETGAPWPSPPGQWAIDNDGVHQLKGDNIETMVLRPLWVEALTRNSLGTWGVSLKFFDLDWRLRQVALPRDRLHEQGGVLGRELAAFGLPLVPGKEKWVSRFIVLQEGITLARILATGRLGWFDAPNSPAVFVMPDQVIGQFRNAQGKAEPIVYQPDTATLTAETLHPAGTLDQWREQVAEKIRGNPILMFAAMTALAGPLLKPCQEQSGGFHLYGTTTGGKTTAAQVAASVWGCGADPQEGPDVTSIRKWYTTGNALEAIAEVHNDQLLTLDEISEVDEQQLGRIIYQLAGGLSKGRAQAGGGLRAMKSWRLLFFSTGEKSVKQMLALAGQQIKGGQVVRLPDIPADDSSTGRRAIIVETGGETPKVFAQNLKAACASYYGLAGPTFVAMLAGSAEEVGLSSLTGQMKERLFELEERLSRDVANDAPPEVRRVFRRFALVALAGTLAAGAGILPYTTAEVIDAVADVRDRWLSELGEERSEQERALSHLRDQIIAHQSRITAHDQACKTGERVAFLIGQHYAFTPTAFGKLCGDHNATAVLHQLKARGWLWHDKDRLTHRAPAIDVLNGTRPNLYFVSKDLLGEPEALRDQAPLNLDGSEEPIPF